ncbi:MAG: hypothetical protein U5J82_13275 [Desulfobacterales bacterium]|nr:hypothetical protein [Desulfobacterales bacterium]
MEKLVPEFSMFAEAIFNIHGNPKQILIQAGSKTIGDRPSPP